MTLYLVYGQGIKDVRAFFAKESEADAYKASFGSDGAGLNIQQVILSEFQTVTLVTVTLP